METVKGMDWRQQEQEEIQILRDEVVESDAQNEEESKGELRKEDYRGWLTVPGTDIDYPVMQGSDNEFYLYHSYNGSYSGRGSLFLDYENRLDDTNITVHGHNLGQYGMFSQLLLYQDIDFLEQNPSFEFQVDGNSQKYDIFAVMVFDVNNFDQFDFSQREVTEDWLEYIRNHSLSVVNETVSCNDKVMTLSTCLYPRKTEWRVIVFGRLSVEN